MAVFLITNNSSLYERLKSDSVIIDRGLAHEFQCQIGDYWLHVYKEKVDVRPFRIAVLNKEIFFFGSVFYKKKFAAEAVKMFYEDLKIDKVDPSKLMGSFCIFYLNDFNKCQIINDSGAIYQLYSNSQGDFITNSFLISTSIAQNKTIDEMALNANLLVGYMPYPDTLFSDIKRIQCEQKWGKFTLNRYHIKSNTFQFKNYKENVHYQTSQINAYVDNLRGTLLGKGVEMGISGGYDSRLILSMLLDKGISIHAHTHFKKNDPDPIIAKELCDLAGIPLKLISERPSLNTQEDFDTILKGSFLQFDGRVNSMMDLGKYEYTRDYRVRLFNPNDITVTGVGGEMYRNHNYFNKSRITVDQFIIYYIINHRNWANMHNSKKSDFIDYIKKGVEPILDDSKYVSYKDSKRYYKTNWLRDWHGTRNTAENHFTSYVSPFADSFLSEAALHSVDHHGLLGKFEIDLIRAQNPNLTKLNSSYGFSFEKIPFWGSQKEYLKILTPTWVKLAIASKVRSIKPVHNINIISTFQTKYINSIEDYNLYFNKTQFIQNSGNIELTYSLGYAINKLI